MQHSISRIKSFVFLALLFATNANSSVRVLSQLGQFDRAPEIILPRLASPAEKFDLQKLGRPAILIFGEAYNQQTLESLVKLKEIVETIGLKENDISVFLIISHTPEKQQAEQLAGKEKISAEILLDQNLKAFGDYGVTVLPSIVVIDKQDRVDLALSGVPLSFADAVEDAILLATERITLQQFESSRSATEQTAAQQESLKRAQRLTSLARQLANRNYTELALKRYRQVLELDDTYTEARVGVARCLIKLNLLPDAIEELQKILQKDAEHVEANLVTAQIEIIRGPDGIEAGKQRIQRILSADPVHPEANYLMGTVYETQGQVDQAMNYYKKSARLLLKTQN